MVLNLCYKFQSKNIEIKLKLQIQLIIELFTSLQNLMLCFLVYHEVFQIVYLSLINTLKIFGTN